MVYQTGEHPSYSKPTCDLCGSRIQPEEKPLDIRFIVSEPFPSKRGGGPSRHDGHVCPGCDDVDGSLGMPSHDSVYLLKYHYALDEARQAELLTVMVRSKHDREWWLPTDRTPARIREVAATVLDDAPGVELLEDDVDDEIPESYR